MDERRIKAKVAARKTAAEILPLLEWEDGTGADYAEALLNELRKLLPSRKSEEPKAEKPMPLARLEKTQMPFGKHSGEYFCDVPLDYLDWLCRDSEDFLRAIQAYLKHPGNERNQ